MKFRIRKKLFFSLGLLLVLLGLSSMFSKGISSIIIGTIFIVDYWIDKLSPYTEE